MAVTDDAVAVEAADVPVPQDLPEPMEDASAAPAFSAGHTGPQAFDPISEGTAADEDALPGPSVQHQAPVSPVQLEEPVGAEERARRRSTFKFRIARKLRKMSGDVRAAASILAQYIFDVL